MLLNGTPFAFVIDLAALASRREYLKLDKWLTDKIREHGVSFDEQLYHISTILNILRNILVKKLCVLHLSGTFYSGMCDIPQEALPIHYGGFGPRQGPAQKCPATAGDLSHNAGLSAVLCWVRLPRRLLLYCNLPV